MDVLKVLRKDHAAVKDLFTEFDRTIEADEERRTHVFAQIRRELQIHSRAEEEMFYPAIKALNGDGGRLVAQALTEHAQIDRLLMKLSRLKATATDFQDQFEALLENVDHHFEQEEGEIFQFAEKNCSTEQLQQLGGELEQRKHILDQQLAA